MTLGSTARPARAPRASKTRMADPIASIRIAARRVASGDQAGKAKVASPGGASTTVCPPASTSMSEPSLPTTAIAPEVANVRPAGSDASGPGVDGGSESVGVGAGVRIGWLPLDETAANAEAAGDGPLFARPEPARFGTIQMAAAAMIAAALRIPTVRHHGPRG